MRRAKREKIQETTEFEWQQKSFLIAEIKFLSVGCCLVVAIAFRGIYMMYIYLGEWVSVFGASRMM